MLVLIAVLLGINVFLTLCLVASLTGLVKAIAPRVLNLKNMEIK